MRSPFERSSLGGPIFSALGLRSPQKSEIFENPEEFMGAWNAPDINGKGRQEALGAEDPAREGGRLKKAAGRTEREEGRRGGGRGRMEGGDADSIRG